MTPSTRGIHKRIAILGSRGIPAEFGGFETFAEQLAVRLVNMGHSVTVYCEHSQSYTHSTYRGVELRYVSTVELAGLRSIWFDSICILKTLRGYDAVYMLGYHAAFAFALPWLFKTNFWTNMDGLEWKRDKWSPTAKHYLRLMEWFAARFSRRLIADAEGIASHLVRKYDVASKTSVIPYGANSVKSAPDFALINDLELEQHGYYLMVCRLEPENHVREIIEGFTASSSRKTLIVVGDHESDSDYVRTLLNSADDRVKFVGTIFDQDRLLSLRWYCRAYFHGHSVGGTNPSLLEAMACGNHTIAHDNVFNREVTNGKADYFTSAKSFTLIIEKIERERKISKSNDLQDRAQSVYNWDRIAELYQELLRH